MGLSAEGRARLLAKQMLIADDDPVALHLIEAAALSFGFAVSLAQSGAAFRREFQRHPPDVIVLDLVMPPPDGLDLLSELADAGCTCPIIVISGHGEGQLDAAQELARDNGLNLAAVLHKPFRVSALWAELARVLTVH